MTPRMLRVRARGTASVPNYEAQEAGTRRFIGRKYIEVEPGQWGFAPTGETEEVPLQSDYLKAIKDGDLWPADRETADIAGVEFDATFGERASFAAPRPSYPPPAAKG